MAVGASNGNSCSIAKELQKRWQLQQRRLGEGVDTVVVLIEVVKEGSNGRDNPL